MYILRELNYILARSISYAISVHYRDIKEFYLQKRFFKCRVKCTRVKVRQCSDHCSINDHIGNHILVVDS